MRLEIAKVGIGWQSLEMAELLLLLACKLLIPSAGHSGAISWSTVSDRNVAEHTLLAGSCPSQRIDGLLETTSWTGVGFLLFKRTKCHIWRQY